MRYAPAATISALEQKLHTLHGRLFTSGDWLSGLRTDPLPDQRCVMHCREADGEWFVYA